MWTEEVLFVYLRICSKKKIKKAMNLRMNKGGGDHERGWNEEEDGRNNVIIHLKYKKMYSNN